MTRRFLINWWLVGLWQLLGLLPFLLIPIEAVAEQSLPPLLKQSKVLSCAQTESAAKTALSSLWEVEDIVKEFPDENMLMGDQTTLHAATLDIVLKSLLDVSERFPDLRNQVERTLLKWNYCDVFQDGVFYDLESTSTGLKRYRAAEKSPLNWSGFKALGFLGPNENRFVPEILSLDQQSLRSDYEWLFHRIYREQCFPHPDTSELFDSEEARLTTNVVQVADEALKEYPHEWDSECIYPRKPPGLETLVKIEVLPVATPELATQLQLLPVAQLVPALQTNVQLLDLQSKIPLLESKFALYDVPQLVPNLSTTVVITPIAIKVPISKPLVVLDVMTLPVPKLLTRVRIDKPKYVAVKPRPKPVVRKPVRYVGNAGNNTGYYPQTVVQAVQAPQIITRPSLTVNKNASLIERLLGGVSGAGNVLIVDKIQLTVNEYNGTVETAISSSDIGTTLTETRPAMVKEIIESLPILRKERVITASNDAVKDVAKTVPPTKIKVVKQPKKVVETKVVKKPSPYLRVPELQSMLLVSQASYPKPVRIRSKATKSKSTHSRNKKGSKSSSLFSYTPYPEGQKTAKEKSISELLLEYQQYERDRKLGRVPTKKRAKKVRKQSVQAPVKRPDPRLRDVPPLNTELWVIELSSNNKVPVPSLKSKVRVYKKYSAKPLKVPSLSTMIIQQITNPQTTEDEDEQTFEFSNGRFDDKVFEETEVKVIENQLDMLFDEGLSFNGTSESGSFFPKGIVPDDVFENTLVNGKKKASEKKTPKVKPKKWSLGLAGNVYLKQSLKNSALAVGGSINRKIIKDSYYFARVGWNYSLEEAKDPFSYSWGIGYSDWHPGTFSAQLNNWGPIKPEEGLALEKAVANFGYSVKSEFLKKYKLGLSGAVNIPVEGNSSVAGNLRWSPKKNWYANVAVSQPLEGGGTPKWTYGFGYSDWRPNKVNLQYSNYGPNEIPYHNYKENGTWTLSYNWKF